MYTPGYTFFLGVIASYCPQQLSPMFVAKESTSIVGVCDRQVVRWVNHDNLKSMRTTRQVQPGVDPQGHRGQPVHDPCTSTPTFSKSGATCSASRPALWMAPNGLRERGWNGVANYRNVGQGKQVETKTREMGRQGTLGLGLGFGRTHNHRPGGNSTEEYCLYRGGKIFGRGEFCRENFAVKKSGEKFPQRKLRGMRPTTSLQIQMQDVQQCTRRREGTKMCLFATCSGCVTGMHWNAVLPKILKVPTRK